MSSNEVAIKIESLGKCYEIYDRPSDRLKQFIFPKLQSMFGFTPKQYFREFWALRDISFEVKKGETVGIIGRNGSGKSTLLQIICGTLTPTRGSVQTNGRIAALLELGSGFNPEFTGRENVYLNASVLGITKDKIDSRFEDIVAFADIGDFIDQPIKTYSSGMLVRLAFAVIAHVDADILVVDEALAVGDAIFTQKCMRFIREFQKNGILLFVSHDTSAVQGICNRGIWLSKGMIGCLGTSTKVSEEYLQFTAQEMYGHAAELQALENSKSSFESMQKQGLAFFVNANSKNGTNSIASNFSKSRGWKTETAEIVSLSLKSVEDNPLTVFSGGELVEVTISAKIYGELQSPILGFLVKDRLGQDLFGENTRSFTGRDFHSVCSGSVLEGKFRFTLPLLPNGEYVIAASIADGDLDTQIQHHWVHDALVFNISSQKRRYGLVGIEFEKVELKEINGQ